MLHSLTKDWATKFISEAVNDSTKKFLFVYGEDTDEAEWAREMVLTAECSRIFFTDAYTLYGLRHLHENEDSCFQFEDFDGILVSSKIQDAELLQFLNSHCKLEE